MIRVLIGVAIGAAAMWLWLNRHSIGFAVENRDRLTGFQKIIEGVQEAGRL